MNYVLFFVGIIFILAGFMMYRYKGRKKGRKFLIIGIIIGLLLINQCRAGIMQNTYKDAKKAYDLIVSQEAELYIDGKKQDTYPGNISVYDYRSVKVDGDKVYLDEKK